MINHDVINRFSAELVLFFLRDLFNQSLKNHLYDYIDFLAKHFLSCCNFYNFVLCNRSFLQPTWAVNSQLQGISAHHFPRPPAPRPPPPRTSPTQPTRLSLWGLAKALWAQSPRGLDTPQPRTALLSGQDPQAHARSAYSTSRLQQPQFQCTKATTWGPHKPPRHQWTPEGPTWGLRSPVSPGPGWDRGPRRAERPDSQEPLAPFAGYLAGCCAFYFISTFIIVFFSVIELTCVVQVPSGRRKSVWQNWRESAIHIHSTWVSHLACH